MNHALRRAMLWRGLWRWASGTREAEQGSRAFTDGGRRTDSRPSGPQPPRIDPFHALARTCTDTVAPAPVPAGTDMRNPTAAADEVRFSLDYGQCWQVRGWFAVMMGRQHSFKLYACLCLCLMGCGRCWQVPGAGWGLCHCCCRPAQLRRQLCASGSCPTDWRNMHLSRDSIRTESLEACYTMNLSTKSACVSFPQSVPLNVALYVDNIRIEPDGQRARVIVHGRACHNTTNPKCSLGPDSSTENPGGGRESRPVGLGPPCCLPPRVPARPHVLCARLV
jgi:hypothetical protein